MDIMSDGETETHTLWIEQTRTVEATQAELQADNNHELPPLMNPAMLEASEDLTNLSHLNEPAGLCPSNPAGFCPADRP